jgi:hypothetical protein
MSYIRCSTEMKKRKGDRRFEKISNTYSWRDTDGYIWITNGWKRTLKFMQMRGQKLEDARKLQEKHGWAMGAVILTPAEMRYMCRQFVGRELGQLKGFDSRMRRVKKKAI